MKKIALLVFVLSLHLTNYAQVSVDGTPPSFTQTLGTTINTYHLPAVNVQKLLAEDDADQKLDKSQPWRFGKDFEVRLGLNNSGTWETLSNGDRVWRFKIKSKDAKSLNFIFDEFYMPTGAEFYIYNEDKSYVIGSFTSINNKSHGQFSTAPVKGSTVIMEYYEPQAVTGLGKITVSSIIYAYRDLFTHAQTRL